MTFAAPIVPTVPSATVLAGNARLNSADADALSLANGMTAGYGVNDGHLDNWPFDARIYGRWPLQPLRIGLLRNIQGSLPPQTSVESQFGAQYTMYFMYNPNQIISQFALSMSQAAPLYLYGTNSQTAISNVASSGGSGGGGTLNSPTVAVPNLANSQTVSWSLYFDRTYEMWNPPAGSSGNPSNSRGVLKDVAALYNLMGTFLTQAAVPVSTPCEVVFGQNGAGQLWGFTGYISDVTITYGIFRHDMIPSRCEIDLTMTTTYVSQSVPGSSPAGEPGQTSYPNLATAIASGANPAGIGNTTAPTAAAMGPTYGSTQKAPNYGIGQRGLGTAGGGGGLGTDTGGGGATG